MGNLDKMKPVLMGTIQGSGIWKDGDGMSDLASTLTTLWHLRQSTKTQGPHHGFITHSQTQVLVMLTMAMVTQIWVTTPTAHPHEPHRPRNLEIPTGHTSTILWISLPCHEQPLSQSRHIARENSCRRSTVSLLLRTKLWNRIWGLGGLASKDMSSRKTKIQFWLDVATSEDSADFTNSNSLIVNYFSYWDHI